jgi:hypothetical protein
MNSSGGCVYKAVEAEDDNKHTTDDGSNKLDVDRLYPASDTESLFSPLGTTMEEGTDEVHPDLLPWEQHPKRFSLWRLLWRLLCGFLSFVLYISVVTDAAARLHFRLFYWSVFISMLMVWRFQRTDKQLPREGGRVYGRIVAKYWANVEHVVPDPLLELLRVFVAGGEPATAQCFFVIEYVFDNVTYQKKYVDETWGLISTETYLELIVPKADPRSPVLAIIADAHHTRRHYRYDQWTGYAVTFFLILPFLLLPLDCCVQGEGLEQCNLIMWFDGVLHWLALLGLYFYHGHLMKQSIKKKQTETQAVAIGKVTKPVESPGRVSYQSLFLPPGDSNRYFIYSEAKNLTILAWILYISVNMNVNEKYAGLSTFLAIMSVAIGAILTANLMGHLYVLPLRARFEEEGLSPKNLTVLKSGGHEKQLFSIIQYETEMTKSDGNTETVYVQARVPTSKENAALILPSNPKSIFFSAQPSTAQLLRDAPLASHHALRTWLILKSALGLVLFLLVIFYLSLRYCREDASVKERLVFALITIALCTISSWCQAMANLGRILDSALGRTGETIIVEGEK